MTDFTKEELDELLRCLEIVKEDRDKSYNDTTDELIKQLIGMIANYCNHDNTDDCKCCESIICDDCGERW